MFFLSILSALIRRACSCISLYGKIILFFTRQILSVYYWTKIWIPYPFLTFGLSACKEAKSLVYFEKKSKKLKNLSWLSCSQKASLRLHHQKEVPLEGKVHQDPHQLLKRQLVSWLEKSISFSHSNSFLNHC